MLNAYLLKIQLKMCNNFITKKKTSMQKYQCEYCELFLPNQYLLNSHKKICTKNKDNLLKCNICDQEFYSSQLLFQHYRKCGKFICFQCDYPFISVNALNSHIQRCHRAQEVKKNKLYKCSICKHVCQNRKELYTHRMSQHGGNDLYEIPNYVEDLNNPEL